MKRIFDARRAVNGTAKPTQVSDWCLRVDGRR